MSSESALQIRPDVPAEMPVIAVKNAVIFPIPNLPIPLGVGRPRTMAAIERAAAEDGVLLVASQQDPEDEKPGPDDLHRFGAVVRVLRLTRSMEGPDELLIEGVCRARVDQFAETDGHLRASVTPVADLNPPDAETQALLRTLKDLASKVIELSPRIPDEALTIVEGIEDAGHLSDLVASQLRISLEEKQELLEVWDVKTRMNRVIAALAHEAAVLEISGRIRTEVRDSLDKHQREVYLREQLRAIRKELGDDDDAEDDLDELAARVGRAQMPEGADKAARRELRRLRRMNPQSAEATVARSYIDWLLDVPWNTVTEDNLDVKAAAALLDADHYGLERVKRRITEYLAVRKLKGDMKGPILCLVGPPGVGKTSLGKSIANALGRNFVRISLGGVRDEAEIRGHRRTYIGSLPGRVIKGLKKAGSINPVFMLDEIDKLGADFRGDPSSALLEVLDPEQNDTFSDHYLEVPVDLSSVLFMATANRLDTIPGPLRDRMEIIEIPGYIQEEKREIARRHLLPRLFADHGLDGGLDGELVELSDDALEVVIDQYTREAGVRTLNRQLAAVLRSVARDIAMEEVEPPVQIGAERARKALGPQKFFPESKQDIATPGVAVGLAWTPVGGEILLIEATAMKGKAQLTLTGQLGEVMKESAHAAMSFIHARAEVLGIDEALFSERKIHLHLPSGAIPKDGPSAGITIVVALTSLLTRVPMRGNLAMTGELTLRGVVLPVGGIKEKVLAAARAGITEIVLPHHNMGDVEEIPAHLREEMTFHAVERIEDVIRIALGVDIPSPSAPIAVPAPEATASAS